MKQFSILLGSLVIKYDIFYFLQGVQRGFLQFYILLDQNSLLDSRLSVFLVVVHEPLRPTTKQEKLGKNYEIIRCRYGDWGYPDLSGSTTKKTQTFCVSSLRLAVSESVVSACLDIHHPRNNYNLVWTGNTESYQTSIQASPPQTSSRKKNQRKIEF